MQTDVNITVLRTFGNTNGRQHQSSMHYWQYKWTSIVHRILMLMSICTSKFYALLAIQMDVNIKVLCTIGNTNGRQHQSSMHYWQYKWTSTSKVKCTIGKYKWTSTSKFYALLAVQMDINIKVLRTIGNTNGRQHQSSMNYLQYKWRSISKSYCHYWQYKMDVRIKVL